MKFTWRFCLNYQAQDVSGKNEQSTQTLWHGAPEARTPHSAQRSCIGCVGLRPALQIAASQF